MATPVKFSPRRRGQIQLHRGHPGRECCGLRLAVDQLRFRTGTRIHRGIAFRGATIGPSGTPDADFHRRALRRCCPGPLDRRRRLGLAVERLDRPALRTTLPAGLAAETSRWGHVMSPPRAYPELVVSPQTPLNEKTANNPPPQTISPRKRAFFWPPDPMIEPEWFPDIPPSLVGAASAAITLAILQQ